MYIGTDELSVSVKEGRMNRVERGEKREDRVELISVELNYRYEQTINFFSVLVLQEIR